MFDLGKRLITSKCHTALIQRWYPGLVIDTAPGIKVRVNPQTGDTWIENTQTHEAVYVSLDKRHRLISVWISKVLGRIKQITHLF